MEDFEILLTQQIPRLRRYARVLCNGAARADDLVQDTLERSWSRRHQWRAGSDLRAWLFTIMHNLSVNHVRRRDHDVAGDAAEPPSPPTQERQIEMRDLRRALARLPADQREVLLLVAVEEMRYIDIAAVLGVPLGTVMSRLSRARERLRLLMDGGGARTLWRIK